MPSREWKRQRFAGAQYREEHRKWYLGDSISAGIGQGYTAFTPVQLAHAIATIANDGVAFRRTWSSASRTRRPARCAWSSASPRTGSTSSPSTWR
jgi:hypothetical protein